MRIDVRVRYFLYIKQYVCVRRHVIYKTNRGQTVVTVQGSVNFKVDDHSAVCIELIYLSVCALLYTYEDKFKCWIS